MSLTSMEALFKKVGYEYKDMEPYKFYDINSKKIKIKSYNYDKDKIEFAPVEALVYKGEDTKYQVLSDNNEVILECAGKHEIFDSVTNEYVAVDSIDKGEVLFDSGIKISFKTKKTNETIPLLDIAVKNNLCYFTNGILSHNSMYGSPFAATGGNSIKFFSSIRNRITKVDVIKDGNDEVGIQIKVRNLKNKTSIPWREAIMNLYFEGGFDTEAEYFDFLTSLGIVEQKGAFFYIPGEEKAFQGKEKVRVWMKEHPEQYNIWKKEIIQKLSGKLESDSCNSDPDKEELPTRGSEVAKLAEQAIGLVAEIVETAVSDEEPPELNI